MGTRIKGDKKYVTFNQSDAFGAIVKTKMKNRVDYIILTRIVLKLQTRKMMINVDKKYTIR